MDLADTFTYVRQWSKNLRSSTPSPIKAMDSEILSLDQWMLLLKFFKDPYLINPYMDLAETFTDVRKWSSVLYILAVKSSTYFLLEFCKCKVLSRRVVI